MDNRVLLVIELIVFQISLGLLEFSENFKSVVEAVCV